MRFASMIIVVIAFDLRGQDLDSTKVGDFVPLKAGNNWIYSSQFSHWSDYPEGFWWFKSRRTIKVDKIEPMRDTIRYTLSVRDSIFSYRYVKYNSATRKYDTLQRPDSVSGFLWILRESPDSVIRDMTPGAFPFINYYHSFPRYALEERLFNGKPTLINDMGYIKYAQNVGLFYYKASQRSIWSGYDQEYNLIRYNNNIVTPVKAKAPSHNKNARPMLEKIKREFMESLLGKRK